MLFIVFGVIVLLVIVVCMQYFDLIEICKVVLKIQVELSYGIFQYYYCLVGIGEFSEEVVKCVVLQVLEVMCVGNDIYYFNIYDIGYCLLMYLFCKDLVGKDMKDFYIDDGVWIYYDQVEVVCVGGGFVNYCWVKLGSKGEVEKVVYVGLFVLWNWVVSSGVYMDDVQKQVLVFIVIMIVFGGVLVLIVLVLSWVIGNCIVVLLKQVMVVVEGIVVGKFDSYIGLQLYDEIGCLLDVMVGMQQQLYVVIIGQCEMVCCYDGGEFSYCIDVSVFFGEYGLMVQEINVLVGSYVQILYDVLDVVQQYVVGDLSCDVVCYLGEKVVMIIIVDIVKVNFGCINVEIKQLVSVVVVGDFSC